MTELKKTPAVLGQNAFVKVYGGIYEHSPWIAETAFIVVPEAKTVEELHAAMKDAVTRAPHDKQLALIKAHPDLAVAAADAATLTKQSAAEQLGAGLNQCTPEEFAEFQQLNADYKEKFGFPFIVAVKGLNRADILAAFRERIKNDEAAEFAAALEQIHKIAGFRLVALQETI